MDFPTRKLRLVDPAELALRRPWLLVHAVRTAFLVCILLISVAYQVRIGNFLNVEIWLPVYAVLLVNFLLNATYLFFFQQIRHQEICNAALFGLDTMAVTLLIYFTGTSQSLFLFLYLVNLILGNMVFSREGGWLLAVWTSICFSALLMVSPEVTGQSLYFSLAVNNFAFVAVSYLGGRLSEQLSDVGTRLQETQSDLVVLQNLNELIVNNIASGLIVVSRTGFVQYFNPLAATVLESNDFLQVKVQDVVPELDWPWLELVDDEGRNFERRDITIKRSGESIKHLEIVAARFKDSEGRLKGWLLILDDRTEQKILEQTLRQQEKLAAVGQLAAGIAHEIRNPLASISGSIQLMLSGGQPLNDETTRLMRIVDKEIDRLNRLITDFLNYVRPENKASLPVNLNNLIREVLEALKFNPKLRNDVDQTLKLTAKSDIKGNRDSLKQALLNLVINAYQAMDKVTNPRIEVETHDQGRFVVLIIRDNGCGIKKENLNRIFEPFHTTKAQGTGLGLAMTHKILQAHDARVLVDSTENVGTKFVIEFPSLKDFHTEGLIPGKQEVNG
ncbi:MAG: nitrogen regulation protein NR(II) [Bdellovibrionales bacterium]